MEKQMGGLKRGSTLLLCLVIFCLGFLPLSFNIPNTNSAPVPMAASLSDWGQTANKSSATFAMDYGNIFRISSSEFGQAYFNKKFNLERGRTYVFKAEVLSSVTYQPNYNSEWDGTFIYVDSGGYDFYADKIGGWQTLTVHFNTNDNPTVNIQMGQGDPFTNSTGVRGTTQFRNITLEETTRTWDSDWNILCLIPLNLNANVMVGGTSKNIQVSMNDEDINLIRRDFENFGDFLNDNAMSMMNAIIDIQVTDTPMTTLTQMPNGKHMPTQHDIYHLAEPFMREKHYDQVICYNRLDTYANPSVTQFEIYSWGLSNMSMKNTWYSSMHLADTQGKMETYKNNSFSERVIIHEFLHTLETISRLKGIVVPNIDDYAYDNPASEYFEREKEYYIDYMTKNIPPNQCAYYKIGLTTESYQRDRFTPITTIYDSKPPVSTGDAQEPIITDAPPPSIIASVNEDLALSVDARVDDGGSLSYQWYSNTSNDTSNGTSLGEIGQENTFRPNTTEIGTFYFYAVVTNFNPNALGAKITTATTEATQVIIIIPVTNAQQPNIYLQPSAPASVHKESSLQLRIVASVTDGGTLTYQWYKNTVNNSSTGEKLDDCTDTVYYPETSVIGIYYYYCIITNTNEDVNGETTVIRRSSVVTVNVIEVPPPKTYKITIYAGEGGTADPSGEITVIAGESLTIKFIPNEGWKVSRVMLNLASLQANESLTLHNVSANHTVNVAFEEINPPKEKLPDTMIYVGIGFGIFVLIIIVASIKAK